MAQTAIDCSLQVPVVSIKQEAQLVLWTLINISELLRTLGILILFHLSTWGDGGKKLQPSRDGHCHQPSRDGPWGWHPSLGKEAWRKAKQGVLQHNNLSHPPHLPRRCYAEVTLMEMCCLHASFLYPKACMLQAFGMQLNERQECLHQNGMMYLLCWGWFIDPGSTWRSLISIISHAVDVEETYTKKKKRLGNLKENSGLNCKIGS